ncbi:TRAP transporter substrate-binding protein [Limimaricola hongkongensis]|nr:ABC transporter substrate-binding protein [Limimaricola hongkongensis]
MSCHSLSVRRLGLVVMALGLTSAAASADEDVLRWRMNSLLYPKLFGEAGSYFAAEVERLTAGHFVIEVRDRMVLDQDSFGALEAGLIDAVWGSAGHHHREDPAFAIFSGFPFGPGPEGFTAWMREGGGAEALDAIYARHGLRSFYCGVLPAEGGGWFRAPVETVADLDGLPMRAFGYGALTLRALGVVPYELPAADIRPALETGLIAAAEFSLPSIDADLGLHEAAGHLYMPGWQQPATSLELLMPERSWVALSDDRRSAIEAACEATLTWSLETAQMRQVAALERFRAEGVEVHDWPEEILAGLRRAWAKVIAEETARDPLLAAAWESYLNHAEGRGAASAQGHID